MTSKELKSALSTEPFQPFRLHFGRGKEIDVVNPGLVVVSQTGRTAFAYHPNSDAFDIIDIMLVERIEYPNGNERRAPQGGGSNGGPPADRR